MKYWFVTIMHNMKLENVKNRGITLFPSGKISNGSQIIENITKSKLMTYTSGSHSTDEFNNKVYFYIENEFKDIFTINEMDKVGTKYTFYLLRIIQSFVQILWEIKDNNVYVRDGFLIVYTKSIEDGCTYKASLSEIYTLSTLERNTSLFFDNEIRQAINRFEAPNFNICQIDLNDYQYPTDDLFFHKKNSDRVNRAYYFIESARSSCIFPMKIVFYCTALECLFSTSSSEITHKIAERVALVIGNTEDDKRQLYKLIKKAYGIRSAIVHGARLNGESMDLQDTTKSLDNVLRALILKDSSFFNKNDNELEDIFVDLLFK